MFRLEGYCRVCIRGTSMKIYLWPSLRSIGKLKAWLITRDVPKDELAELVERADYSPVGDQ